MLSDTGWRRQKSSNAGMLTDETAKKEVTGYFKRAGEAYPDEAAEDLELDFDLVMRITEELRKNGTQEEA